MDVIVKVDGDECGTTVYKRDDGCWSNSVSFADTQVYIKLQRAYEDGDEGRPIDRWEARADRATRERVPALASLIGTGRTMAQALEVFYRPVVAERRRWTAQVKFKREQLDAMREIAACFEVHEVQEMFKQVRGELVAPWSWDNTRGGSLKNGNGNMLARVWCPADGVVCWHIERTNRKGWTTTLNGYKTFTASVPSNNAQEEAISACRKLVDQELATEVWRRS